ACSALGVAVACGSSPSPTDVGTGGSPTDPNNGASSGTTPPGGTSSGNPPGTSSGNPPPPPPATGAMKTVFVVMMENHSWGTIKASKSAGYINTLAMQGAHAENYYTPAGNHPSEPNYIWLEAGDNLGITTDDPPATNHKSTTDHLVTQLEAKGVTWKAYSEDITAGTCPLAASGLFDPKHTPMLFFDDVTGTNNASYKRCTDHVVPYTQLADDIAKNQVPQYAFITPNLCDDMHGETFGTTCNSVFSDTIKAGNDWLQNEIPKIQASQAYKDDGVIFLLWDEGDETGFPPVGSDGPIPFIVLGPKVKPGYVLNTKVTHSALLRTIQTIFGVPYLRGAMTSPDLAEVFTSFP
ncbi:MAG TPA: alkaline phosphatase family protein, partial [Labilithrix sp.]